jgi:hypothetical protein
MRVIPPWNKNADFVTYYRGNNLKINNSFFQLSTQRIILYEDLEINGNVEENCCFEMSILKRKFLIVLDHQRFY